MEIRFVDCRDQDAYLTGHLPGAPHADPERDLTGTDGGGRHPLPTPAAFAEWASAAGIGRATFVVGYDAGTGWAARLWWLLRHFGHDEAAVLDFAGWRGPLRVEAERIAPAQFVARPRADDTASADELLARLGDPRLVLVDARAPERYRGEIEPLDRIAGRIPGARNLPFQAGFPPPSDLLEAEELVAYCGSGVTACANVLSLTLAGRDDVRLYPGSWSEWSELGHPVETGSAERR
ncbi:MAG: sulfurtransferase [Actinobacteria bacterium]|nr:sulfurtransferase [Actinomycetota bacterium]